MSIARHYMQVENSEDSRTALGYVFMMSGDTPWTADKRVNECFFTRGRGRSLNTDLFSYVQSYSEVEELDDHVEENLTKKTVDQLNIYIKGKIESIENEYESEGRVTKNVSGLILDLKAIYSYIISRVYNLGELKDIVTPNIDESPWLENWDISHLDPQELINYTKEEIKPVDKGETKLIKAIRLKIETDLHSILDNLIEHFKKTGRKEVVEAIKVKGFKFINDTATNISNIYNLDEESHNLIDKSRIQYISRVKKDLKYSQELVGINSSTYKKRSNRIKMEMIDLGEDLKTGNLNLMQDYLIN